MKIVSPEVRRWTDQRLDRLFRRYNHLYWSGRLPLYSLRVEEQNSDHVGLCECEKRTILIVVKGRSDRAIRSTVLHEMCHAAAPRPENHGYHGYAFWKQVEMLLRKRAPITIKNAEAPRISLLGGSIPARFPLSRKLVERLERRRQRLVLRMLEGTTSGIVISHRNIIEEFGGAEAAESPWQRARLLLGHEYGLLDVGGNPKNKWATRIIERGRKVHAKARREYLFDEKL
jgi:hypothetical protein